MKTTLEAAEKSGDLKLDSEGDLNSERMARIGDLETRVDELLAQLAA